MKAEDIVRMVHGKRIKRGKWRGKCPAHGGNSLEISEGKKAVMLRCWGGCSVEEVVAALRLRMSDLWYENKPLDTQERRRLAREKFMEQLYERERRMMDLKHFLRAAELPPHRRLIRTQTRFDWDIDAFCSRVDSDRRKSLEQSKA